MALSSSSPSTASYSNHHSLRSISKTIVADSDSPRSSNGGNAPTTRTTRTTTRTVLFGLFIVTNLLSALTWSVFHSYFQSGDLSAILTANLLNDAPALEESTDEEKHDEAQTVSLEEARSVVTKALEAERTSISSFTVNNTTVKTPTYSLLKPYNASMRPVLYQRMEDHFKGQKSGMKPRLNRDSCIHRNITKENQNVSTIEYIACCGLGHRLGRMSNAAFLATKLKAHFYGFWRCCDDVEVFSYLFGSEPIILYDEKQFNDDDDQKSSTEAELLQQNESAASPGATTATNTTSNNTTLAAEPYHIQFRNEVVGFRGGPRRCKCPHEKLVSDFAFFSTLRERYTKRHIVDDFVQKHFTNQTLSIAIHIRAGNGETGDFMNKNRHISDPEAFVRNTANHIREIAQNLTADPSTRHLAPLIFIATDTQSYVDAFRTALSTETTVSSTTISNNETWTGSSIPPIPVVQLPATTRAAEGEGVMFGVFNKVTTSGEKCLAGWDNVVQDMLVLSHADVVFAPKFSSFTQTIPVVLSLGKKERRVRTPFCDIRHDELNCYEDFHQWCCGTPWPARSNTYHDVDSAWRGILLSEEQRLQQIDRIE